MKKIIIILVSLILFGCDFIDSDAVKFVKSATKGDLEYVWEYISDNSRDKTLTDIEKRELLDQFSKSWPKSLPDSTRDLIEIIKNIPEINEIGSKKKGDKTIYALTATYHGNKGYIYGNSEIARVIKFTIDISNETGMVSNVSFGKVLEKNEQATYIYQEKRSKILYSQYLSDKENYGSNILKILRMYGKK